MITVIYDFLKLYITEDQIPLKQILTERDIHQLSVSLAHITASPETTEFNNIAETIFISLGDKGIKAILNSISNFFVQSYETEEAGEIELALLGYYCLMYFKSKHNLPVEKILFVLNKYMNNHIVNIKDVIKMDLINPISNPIPINDKQYIRFTGRQILPPNNEVKEEFKTELTNLLIKTKE